MSITLSFLCVGDPFGSSGDPFAGGADPFSGASGPKAATKQGSIDELQDVFGGSSQPNKPQVSVIYSLVSHKGASVVQW